MTTGPEATPAVDELAQEIRRVDGSNSLGAGALAEALMPFFTRASRAPVDGAGWRPIETAPKDGTMIDLFTDGERWTDCRWGAPEHCCGEAGQYCDSDWHGSPDGWVWTTMNEFLPSEEPPTHWMPLPAAPGTHPAPASPDAEMVRVLRDARAIVESDMHAAEESGDGDWLGMSRQTLNSIDALLSKHESDQS